MKIRWAIVAVIAATVGCSQMHKDKEDEEDEANEVKMTIDQVPPAVKTTLMQQAGGATIKTVDKEQTKAGQTIYETDVMSGGKNWEIKVAEDGKLISKKIDNEDEEKADKKKEKEEDDEKDEHK